MMFDNDKSGAATVMTEMTKMRAGTAEPDVHYEIILLTMNMTVLEIAEMILIITVVSITMLAMKMTVMMVASSLDNGARE